MSSIWSPHLRLDRRATRRSVWEPPSVNWSTEGGWFGRRNVQIVMFIVGFIFPFAWMIAALLPLPPRPIRNMSERDNSRSNLDSSHDRENQHETTNDYTRQFGPMDEARYESAKWWRRLNRYMSFVGVLVLAAIAVLVVVGINQGWWRRLSIFYTIPHHFTFHEFSTTFSQLDTSHFLHHINHKSDTRSHLPSTYLAIYCAHNTTTFLLPIYFTIYHFLLFCTLYIHTPSTIRYGHLEFTEVASLPHLLQQLKNGMEKGGRVASIIPSWMRNHFWIDMNGFLVTKYARCADAFFRLYCFSFTPKEALLW